MTENQEGLVKSFTMIDDSMQKMWDMWLVSLGSVTSTQDKIENMTRKQMDQHKAAREEMIKMVEDLSKQMRRNQGQIQMLVEDVVTNTYEQINYKNQNLIDGLSKKVEELSQKLAVVSSAAFPSQKAV